MVLRRLPPSRLAPPPGRTAPDPARQDRHHLRMPALREPLPRRATLRGMQLVVPTPRPRRNLPPLRRARRRLRPDRRQPIQRHPTTLTMNTNPTRPTTPRCGVITDRIRREESDTPQSLVVWAAGSVWTAGGGGWWRRLQ